MGPRFSEISVPLFRILQLLLLIGVTELVRLVGLMLDDPVENALVPLGLIGFDRSRDGGVAGLLGVGSMCSKPRGGTWQKAEKSSRREPDFLSAG
jgi:hypothetical protein